MNTKIIVINYNVLDFKTKLMKLNDLSFSGDPNIVRKNWKDLFLSLMVLRINGIDAGIFSRILWLVWHAYSD